MKLIFVLLVLLTCLYGCAAKQPMTIGELVEQCHRTHCDEFERSTVTPE